MRKPKLLLTGAAGMVGSHLIKLLLDSDLYQVRAVWHNKQPHTLFDEIEYVQGDLGNPEFCHEIAQDIDYAILAAAYTSGSADTVARPWRQVTANLAMNIHLLESLAMNQSLQKLIFISSATVYQAFTGHIKETELDLNQLPHPSYLGVGMVMRYLEQACVFWQKVSGADFNIIRASNIFGPFGRFDPQRSNFIPALIRKAVALQDPFEIWGNPDVVRDVIFAEDFAAGVIRLLSYKGLAYDVFNLGSAQQITVQNVIDWVLRYAEHQPSSFLQLGERTQMVPFRALDCSKLTQHTGWVAETPIEIGVKKTLEWWKENQSWWTR